MDLTGKLACTRVALHRAHERTPPMPPPLIDQPLCLPLTGTRRGHPLTQGQDASPSSFPFPPTIHPHPPFSFPYLIFVQQIFKHRINELVRGAGCPEHLGARPVLGQLTAQCRWRVSLHPSTVKESLQRQANKPGGSLLACTSRAWEATASGTSFHQFHLQTG